MSQQEEKNLQKVNDDYADIQQLLSNKQQTYYDPGIPEKNNELPKLKEQEAHIALQKEEKEEDNSSQISDKSQDQIEQNKEESKEIVSDKQISSEIDQIPKTIQAQEPVIWNEDNIPDLKEFLIKPCPKGYIIQTTVDRIKSGFNRFYPQYNMYLSNNKKKLMYAKKMPYNITSNYCISLSDEDFSSTSNNTLGKVRANFMGSEFKIYDNGKNPENCSKEEQIRTELGVVLYEASLIRSSDCRKMQIYLPQINENGELAIFKPKSEEEGLLQQAKQGNKGVKFYQNKSPKWNEIIQAFVLNFHGRVTQPSVRNFQMVDKIDDEIVYLQFGRISKDSFNLDIQYPLSLLQAFGIALTSFDWKIACE